MYKTLDNGADRYYVRVDEAARTFSVSLLDQYSIYENTPYRRVWVGKSPRNEITAYSEGHGERFDGNSMLFKVSDTQYLFVGHTIYMFAFADEIARFVSCVGNNGVPYPYAVSASNVIFFLDMVYMSHHVLGTGDAEQTADLYSLYFDSLAYEQAAPDLRLIHSTALVPTLFNVRQRGLVSNPKFSHTASTSSPIVIPLDVQYMVDDEALLREFFEDEEDDIRPAGFCTAM